MIALAALLAASACSPAGLDRTELENLREQRFVIEDEATRREFLLDLETCAGARDTFFRDRIGYEGMAALLRSDVVSDQTVAQLFEQYSTLLADGYEAADRTYGKRRGSFRASFLTLQFSEIVRRDRVSPYLDESEREKLVDLTVRLVEDVSDYRGFDDEDGWRHHVAHASDIALQLGLNEQVGGDARRRLVSALLTQVRPEGISYVHGEPERLARAVAYLVAGSEFSADEAGALLAPIADREGGWESASQSEAGLADRHNTRAFLSALVLMLMDQEDPKLVALREAGREVFRQTA